MRPTSCWMRRGFSRADRSRTRRRSRRACGECWRRRWRRLARLFVAGSGAAQRRPYIGPAAVVFSEVEFAMADIQALQVIDQRIAIARANLRELTEMAAAISGGENEALSADRIT